MPRKARVIVPNCPHHIVQRGHNRRAVFVEAQDYGYYLDNLRELKLKFGVKVYAWCLMTNHIHLICEPGEDPTCLSGFMKHLSGRQSAYVNKLEKRSGSLWEGRYKCSPIQRDEYLLCCIRYVELNPLRAQMVMEPEDYKWSSVRQRLGQEAANLLDLDTCYLGISKNVDVRRQKYIEFLREDLSENVLKLLREAVSRNQLTGNNKFIEEVEFRTGLRVEARRRGRPKKKNCPHLI